MKIYVFYKILIVFNLFQILSTATRAPPTFPADALPDISGVPVIRHTSGFHKVRMWRCAAQLSAVEL